MANLKFSVLKKYDFSFFALMSCIFVVGILNLYSATYAGVRGHITGLYKTQIFWYLFSVFIGIIVSFIRPKTWMRSAYFFYFVNCVLLLLVLFIGKNAKGAGRWLAIGPMRIQPSEMMKMTLVLALGRWFSRSGPESNIREKDLLVPSLLAFFPVVLTVAQPDLGTGIILLLIYAMMVFYRGLRWKVIGILLVVGMLGGVVMYKFGLKEYQRQRITTFFDPWGDATGSGYNAIQSEIAIGSGQLFGKGFKKSSQASLSYLPENHSDFVFSIYNEEHGFFGALFMIGLFVLFILRHIWLASSVLSIFDSLVVVGIMSILFWHTFINMSMVTGLMPIVGIPLPLISYGGSSLLTFGIACGISTSISNSRNFF